MPPPGSPLRNDAPPPDAPPPDAPPPDVLPDSAFTRLPEGTTATAFVQEQLQSAHKDKVTLYLNDDLHFTRFSKDDNGMKAFNECVQGLANHDYCFFVLTNSSKVKHTHVQRLWLAAQDFSMVIAVLKWNPERNTSFPFVGASLAGLLATMEAHSRGLEPHNHT